jgi:hypothetical protein
MFCGQISMWGCHWRRDSFVGMDGVMKILKVDIPVWFGIGCSMDMLVWDESKDTFVYEGEEE